MHSGDLSEIDQASLSEQEKEALLQVMERAKVTRQSDRGYLEALLVLCVGV